MTVRFLTEAESEFDETVDYYNSRLDGLGTEFATEVRDGLKRISEYPRVWQPLGQRIRRYRMSRFPYGLVYAVLPDEIVIVAVMHLHRKPEYWKTRLTRI